MSKEPYWNTRSDKSALSSLANGEEPTAARCAAIQVVGLGGSAGGLEALSHFFDAMPADSGCAFVVVLHVDPKRESEMAHILSARYRRGSLISYSSTHGSDSQAR